MWNKFKRGCKKPFDWFNYLCLAAFVVVATVVVNFILKRLSEIPAKFLLKNENLAGIVVRYLEVFEDKMDEMIDVEREENDRL